MSVSDPGGTESSTILVEVEGPELRPNALARGPHRRINAPGRLTMLCAVSEALSVLDTEFVRNDG
jgi:hypothetical protein